MSKFQAHGGGESGMRKSLMVAFLAVAVGFLCFEPALSQSTVSLSGRVVIDGSRDPVGGAEVTLFNLVNGFRQGVWTASDGTYQLSNVPFHTYSLGVKKQGFVAYEERIVLRSAVPVYREVRLRLSVGSESVTVQAVARAQLVEPQETGSRAELSVARMEKLPLPVGGRGLEGILMTLPGFAANANGAIHPRGAHNQMTYVVDGMPISDQLTGSFATGLDPSIVQTVELYTGNVPAEFGGKISGVANIITRSGLGSDKRFFGSTQLAAAGFDTLSNVTHVSGEAERLAYFFSASSHKSNRFLDQVSLDNLHNGGNAQRAFGRFDYQVSPRDQLRLNLMAGRSSFQVANFRSQHAAGQDQRQLLRDASVSLGWLHTLDARTAFDATFSYRGTIAQLFPSPADTPVTAAQARHLTTVTLATRLSTLRGPHNLRAGFDYQRFPVSENFSFAVTDPDFNAPETETHNPNLLAFDLSRGGSYFHFSQEGAGTLVSAFIQDNIQWRRLMFSLGLRHDVYRFLVKGSQLQPRVGLAFHLPVTGTVLRASYNRTFQTPPNENLLLASSRQAVSLVPPSVRRHLGEGFLPIRPERQNVFELGLQQAVAARMSLNLVYYHKNSRDLQDNDNFLNTGIIFPTSLWKSRVNGFEARAEVLPVGNLSGSLSLTHGRVVATPPFTGGLFLGSDAVEALSSGPFIIDHDQKLALHGILHYRLHRNLWVTGSVRHDSGLVSNPSDPDEVAQDPDFADLLPYVNLTSDPPRVRPRTVLDLILAYEHTRHEGRQWDLQFQVLNLFNRIGLYNFQSIFVGTRLIQPRTLGLKLRWHW